MTQSHKTPLQTYGASCGLDSTGRSCIGFDAFLRGSPENRDLLQDVYCAVSAKVITRNGAPLVPIFYRIATNVVH